MQVTVQLPAVLTLQRATRASSRTYPEKEVLLTLRQTEVLVDPQMAVELDPMIEFSNSRLTKPNQDKKLKRVDHLLDRINKKLLLPFRE